VSVTLVPVLAKRTPLRWIGYRMEYRVTREGWIYIAVIVLVALAAINTGNNLLFLVLACLIASILMSGILSSITLIGVDMRLNLPEHIFAGQMVRTAVELQNEKLTLPSFSLRVEGVKKKGAPAAALLENSRLLSVSSPEDIGAAERADAFLPARRLPPGSVSHRHAFPFGFLQKARRIDLARRRSSIPPWKPRRNFWRFCPAFKERWKAWPKAAARIFTPCATTCQMTAHAMSTGKLPRAPAC